MAAVEAYKLNVMKPPRAQLVMARSGANQHRVKVSKWLADKADILTFDKLTSGINVIPKYDLHELMGLHCAGQGTADLIRYAKDDPLGGWHLGG